MSGTDTDQTEQPVHHLQPVYADGSPILYDGNFASIAGLKFEVHSFFKRSHLFQPLLKHGAVALSNGKLAVSTFDTARFISGEIDDPRPY